MQAQRQYEILFRVVTCVMDHCFTDEVQLARTRKPKKRSNRELPDQVLVATKDGSKSFIQGEGIHWHSEITDWFCRFLRSIFKCEALKGKGKEDPVTGELKAESCSACMQIDKQIHSECGGVYLDGDCLQLHKPHLQQYCAKSKIDLAVKGNKQVILAHYNPEGVYFNIFPMTDGMS